MKTKIIAPVYGFLVAAAGGAVTYVKTTCPDLIPNLGSIVIGSIIAGYALYAAKPEKAPGLKATALGVVTCAGTVLFAKLTSTCPDLMAAGWTGALLGVASGVALWSKSPKQLTAGK
jgi:hypothetical protein